MDYKKKYIPVNDIVRKTSKKALAQGALTSCDVRSYCKQGKSKESIDKNALVQHKNPKEVTVICHSSAVVHKQLSDCSQTEKIFVESPTTVLIGSSRSELGSIDSGIHHSSRLIQKDIVDNFSTGRPVYCENEINDFETATIDDTLQPSSTKGLEKQLLPTESHGDTKTSKTNKDISKKKKHTRVVASRYMSQSTQQPTQSKVQKPQSSKAILNMSRAKPKINIEPKTVKPVKVINSANELGDKTDATSNEKASTPTSRFRSFFEPDMSAIQAAAPNKFKSTKSDIVSKSAINCLYAKYLRCAYLKSALQKTSQVRQKMALNDLVNLSGANTRLQEEVTELEIEVDTLHHEQSLDLQLDDQSNALGPVLNKLDNVTTKYKVMAENIDTVRHALPIDEVLITSERSLELSLKQMENVLNDVSMLTHGYISGCTTAADLAHTLKSTTANEINSFSNIDEALVLSKKLLTKEANLSLQLETESRLT